MAERTSRTARTRTRNLVMHFRRLTFLIVPSPETLALSGRHVRLHESADGEVEIRYAGQLLPYTVLDKQPLVARRRCQRPRAEAASARRASGSALIAETLAEEIACWAVTTIRWTLTMGG